MASREKRPLAPSKSKQKANNDSPLPSADSKNKKGKAPTRQQQLAYDIIEAVAVGNQLPAKINAALPRKKALKNLKRKQKIKVTKSKLIKIKIARKVPIKAIRKVAVDPKRTVKAKKLKKPVEGDAKSTEPKDEASQGEADAAQAAGEAKSAEAVAKAVAVGAGSKNSLKNKRSKVAAKSAEAGAEGAGLQEKSAGEAAVGSLAASVKTSPKAGKKTKSTVKKPESAEDTSGTAVTEAVPKGAKATKAGGVRRNTSKEREAGAKTGEGEAKKTAPGAKSSKNKKSNTKDTESVKVVISEGTKSSYVETIEGVIASMLSDTGLEEPPKEAEKLGKKLKRSKKPVDKVEKLLSESEIKKEENCEEDSVVPQDVCPAKEPGVQLQNETAKLKRLGSLEAGKTTPVQRKRLNRAQVQRSLRNGKLRKLSDSGILVNPAVRKRRRMNSDGPDELENCGRNICDIMMDSETRPDELLSETVKGTVTLIKSELPSREFEEASENGAEVENNNNGERTDRTGEVGPTLRSKTRTVENPSAGLEGGVVGDLKTVQIKSTAKDSELQDDLRNAMSLDQTRKDSLLAKLADKPKSRRSSLNMEMKKTVTSFYGADKTDANPKSQIDQMIENIKLNIAKSIENKVFGSEKSLALGKNFEIPKSEEIVAPLSAESQKTGLEESADDVKPNNSKNDNKSEGSEGSVPKVADTAKEIEKLVMGDTERDTGIESQKSQKNGTESGTTATASDIQAYKFDDTVGADRRQKNATETGNVATINDSLEVFDFVDADGAKGGFSRSNRTEIDVDGREVIAESNQSAAQNSTESSSKVGEHQESCHRNTDTRKSTRNSDESRDMRRSVRTSDKPTRSFQDHHKVALLDCEVPEANNETAAQSSLSYETFKDELKESIKILTSDSKSNANEKVTKAASGGDALTPSDAEKETTKVKDIVDGLTEDRTNDSDVELQLNASTRSGESETLESISKEVERLVAESETSKSAVPSEILGKIETCNKIPTYDDFNDIVDTEAETNRFLEALESSFTDSEILTMAPDIGEVLASKELTHSDDSHPKDTLDLDKLTGETVSDALIKKQETVTLEDQETGFSCQVVSVETHDSSTKDYDPSTRCSKSPTRTVPPPSYTAQWKELLADDESSEEVQGVVDDTVNSRLQRTSEETFSETQTNDQTTDGERSSINHKSDQQDPREPTEEQKLGSEPHVEDVSPEEHDQPNEHSGALTEANSREGSSWEEHITTESSRSKADQNSAENEKQDSTEESSQIRTRRAREVKRRKDYQQLSQNAAKSKRSKRDGGRYVHQNKEETLLDNEVAKINENNQSLTGKYGKSLENVDSFRGFSEGGSESACQTDRDQEVIEATRSKSENDLDNVKRESESDGLSRNQSESGETPVDDGLKQPDNRDGREENVGKAREGRSPKTPETLAKDSDEASTSGESSSSVTLTSKILETPEDKAKKESILRLLGLESLEKAAERMNHQKAKKEQYTGTLKTVIRVQKEKDKKRSRSPLKMVLKQGRGDGDGDSPEFYTIQKEFGSGGLGDSSSGANRKFTTNHRHSCDEDNEETPPKDRQSLVIPEKSSSFSIHPGRLCADVCCYCFGKFGSLDTPMHLAQMKSDERRKKILNAERHLTKDSCLCDACYRHVDRKANTSPTNMQSKPPRQHRQLMVSKCSARECREPARHHVKRRWLLKIKTGLQDQVDIDWESSQHTSMSFCVEHYSKIERFLTCALCKRRLARNHTHQLVATETEELNQRLRQQGIPVPLSAGTFVCKLCRYFTQLQLKYKDIENMNANHKSFFKSYRKRILHYHDIEVLENEEEDSSSHNQSQPTKEKERRRKSKCGPGKGGSSKSPDGVSISASEKSTPEPSKNEGACSETDYEVRAGRSLKSGTSDSRAGSSTRERQMMSVEETVENLKKRKTLDAHGYNTGLPCTGNNDLVEILAMDKEVTLTRLPKRARSNDITPVVQRLGANPSISVRTLFPGEEEMNLHASVEFGNVREVTPQGWEKCATMIQYDRDTKLLWQELQRPYGNQSSFLRHLILLEKYYRSGDLVLAPNASRNAINYSTSVQNRLISYEGPEKMDEPIMEPISSEFANPRRLSGGFVLERDRLSLPSTSSLSPSLSSFPNSRVLKMNPGVSIIKKPPPSLHRLSIASTSAVNGVKRKDGNRLSVTSGGKVFQLSEPEFKRLQSLKMQKQKQMLGGMQSSSAAGAPTATATTSAGSTSPSGAQGKPATQYQKAQIAAQTQFQKHLRMQQEMLNRQTRSDFEPLICDVRSMSNENNPTQNLLNNLNLPKSIQVTTKPPHPIPILPKIPKSLTVIPQTVPRPADN